MSAIYGKSSIDMAMTVAYNNTRDWMMSTLNMTENEVITAITVAVDFGITQVVDGNWGVHAVVPKKPFGLPTIGTKSADTSGSSSSPSAGPAPAPASNASKSVLATVGGAFMLVVALMV